MPLREQTDPKRVEWVLKLVFSQQRPPVARCRLLSSGFGPAHTLMVTENIVGSQACLGCGCCLDVCPVLMRNPAGRRAWICAPRWRSRRLVGEDCDRCGNCALACPQVDPTIKHYLVQTHLAEGMAQLLTRATSDEMVVLDLVLNA